VKTASKTSIPFTLPALPWKENALAPIISANTLSFHYGKHHKSYVDNLNRLVAGTALSELSLEQLMKHTAHAPERRVVFNNAAQAWNHAFFWRSLRPYGGGRPVGALKTKIEKDFGNYEAFEEQFLRVATGQFGSGWAWLVLDGNELRIVGTANADTPMAVGKSCLLVIDVWEHAYYLDYQNRRADYVVAVISRLLDWDFASEQFALAEVEQLIP